MIRILMACVLLIGCGGNPIEDPNIEEAADLPAFSATPSVQTSAPEEPEPGIDDRLNLANPPVDEAELARTERTFERPAVSVAAMRARSRARRRPRVDPRVQREQLWDLAALPQADAEATALLRISASEHEFENELDTIGVFQVMRAVRRSTCDNTSFGSHVRRRITQCETASGAIVDVGPHETIVGARETRLSAMRRLSERALGVVDPRTRRGRWISSVTLDCSEPDHWPEEAEYEGEGWRRRLVHRARGPWEGSRIQENCREVSTLVQGLLDGSIRRRVTRATPLAWGGRCERHCDDPTDRSTCRQTGACDDGHACRRGLRRIPNTETSNALWCRPGTPHCPAGVDPVCEALGYGLRGEPTEVVDVSTEDDDTQT